MTTMETAVVMTDRFKEVLRGAGYKGQMTVATGSIKGEWIVKVIEPNQAEPRATPELDMTGTGINLVNQEASSKRRNTVTTFTIQEVSSDDGDLILPDEEIEVDEEESDEGILAMAQIASDGGVPALDDPAGEVDQEVDPMPATVAAANTVEQAERAARSADSAPVNKADPVAVAARIQELLADKVHADKKSQREIRRKLRSLGYFISKVTAPAATIVSPPAAEVTEVEDDAEVTTEEEIDEAEEVETE